MCDEFCGHCGLAFGKHHQDGLIQVVVNEDNALFCCFNQISGKDIGVKDLAVEENALNGR